MHDVQPAPGAIRYDRFTMLLHWLTAALVVILFAIALVFNAVGRGPTRHSLQLLHVSFGIALAAVFVVRVIWAVTGARTPGRAHSGGMDLLARVMHGLLYLMLTAQVALGFLYRWAQGEEFTFFGLFAVPPAFAPNKGWSRTFDTLHYDLAWAFIVFAGGHALVALVRQFALRDGTLGRMLPTASAE